MFPYVLLDLNKFKNRKNEKLDQNVSGSIESFERLHHGCRNIEGRAKKSRMWFQRMLLLLLLMNVQAISMRYAIHHILPNCVPSCLLQNANSSRIIPSLFFSQLRFPDRAFSDWHEPRLKTQIDMFLTCNWEKKSMVIIVIRLIVVSLRLEKLAPHVPLLCT